MGSLGAFALLPDGDGRLLLGHRRDADVWNLPGGQVERGESPWQAAMREARDETGLEVSVLRLALVDHCPERDELVLAFACVIEGGALTLNDEADQLAWFALDELPANIAPRHAERVLSGGSGPAKLRVQPGPGVRESLPGLDHAQRQSSNRDFRVGAFATVLNERGDALLGLRWDGDFWGQPGGGVEPNETPWDAVVRESREETGIAAGVEGLVGVYCWPEQSELIFSFLCAAIGGSLQTRDETRAVRFFAPGALPSNLLLEHRQRIVDALKLAPDQETLLAIPDGLSAPEEIRRWRARHGFSTTSPLWPAGMMDVL
jgi:ADP-ribose pyrophosphatase YjhB (NUDIX family)